MQPSRDDLYLMKIIARYGDPWVCVPIDSCVDKLIRGGLAKRVMQPHHDYELTYEGREILATSNV